MGAASKILAAFLAARHRRHSAHAGCGSVLSRGGEHLAERRALRRQNVSNAAARYRRGSAHCSSAALTTFSAGIGGIIHAGCVVASAALTAGRRYGGMLARLSA